MSFTFSGRGVMKMDKACFSKTSATLPIFTRCQRSETRPVSILKNRNTCIKIILGAQDAMEVTSLPLRQRFPVQWPLKFHIFLCMIYCYIQSCILCITITITRITLPRIIIYNNYDQTVLLAGGVHVCINKKKV
jgi:hypothetical protein